MSLREELEFAWRLAAEVGGVIRDIAASGDLRVERKADDSPVTIADRRAEQRLREAIEARFPQDGILGEEYGEKASRNDRRWILDPIDGTKSFVHGVPLCGTLVALEQSGVAVLGVISIPLLFELAAAAKGEGAFWWPRLEDPTRADSGHRPARVSSVDRLEAATICLTTPRSMIDPRVARLAERCLRVRGWGDCYGHLLVATGRIEAQLDPAMHVWDNAAVLPLVQEAGGQFSGWDGDPSHLAASAVTTNGFLHEEVLQYLKE
ncbi:MAG: inositol monophosphatase family protein [Planctomycetota bacterium]